MRLSRAASVSCWRLRISDTQLAILGFRHYDGGLATDHNDTGSVDGHHDNRAHNYCHGSSNDHRCRNDYNCARCGLNYAACHDHGARCVSAVKFFTIYLTLVSVIVAFVSACVIF